jgi:hypothetical protein
MISVDCLYVLAMLIGATVAVALVAAVVGGIFRLFGYTFGKLGRLLKRLVYKGRAVWLAFGVTLPIYIALYGLSNLVSVEHRIKSHIERTTLEHVIDITENPSHDGTYHVVTYLDGLEQGLKYKLEHGSEHRLEHYNYDAKTDSYEHLEQPTRCDGQSEE